MLSVVTRRRPSLDLFQIEVRTERPCQSISLGRPVFNETTLMTADSNLTLERQRPSRHWSRRSARLEPAEADSIAQAAARFDTTPHPARRHACSRCPDTPPPA